MTNKISDSISPTNWINMLEQAEKGYIIGIKKNEIRVFIPKGQIAQYPHLSIKEINNISENILLKTERAIDRLDIKDSMKKLIHQEVAKANELNKKTHTTMLNILKWISYASILFIPLGIAISVRQHGTEKEMEKLQQLESQWKQKDVASLKNLQIADALSQNTWSLPTNPKAVLKSVLGDDIMKQKTVLLGQYLVPQQVKSDFHRSPMIRLNGNQVFSNFSQTEDKASKEDKASIAYGSLIKAFGETSEKHPVTDLVLGAFTQNMLADVIQETGKIIDNNLHLSNLENSCYDITIHKNSQNQDILTIHIKGLLSELVPEITTEKVIVALRAISRKFEMPLEELKRAAEEKNMSPLVHLKGTDRISDDLFKRGKKTADQEENEFLSGSEIQIIGSDKSIKLEEELFTNEEATEILENFDPVGETKGTWDIEKAWNRIIA